jgi:ribosomal protein S18 acetylase RimI-like enzyme
MRPGDNLDGQFAEKIQIHCILYFVIAQSCHEVGMFRIVLALSDETISQARNLFREYASTIGVEVCLGDFERETATLPGLYAPPGGRLLLAIEESFGSPGEAIGCVGLRRFDQAVGEMKRLYVRSSLRGKGAGAQLVRSLIAEARSIGYQRMVLDTLPSMEAAQKLYRTLGFREIAAYQKNPIPDSLFFEFLLR